MTTVRQELRWGLGLCLGLTAIALVWMPSPSTPQRAAKQAGAPADWPEAYRTNRPASRPVPPTGEVAAALPKTLERVPFTPAERDLFERVATAAEVAPTAQPAPPAELQGPPLPPPPPAQTARFAGKFRTPDGQTLVYLRDGEQTLLARPGLVLSSGYRIEALLSDGVEPKGAAAMPAPPRADADVVAIRLLYSPLQHREMLRLPVAGAP